MTTTVGSDHVRCVCGKLSFTHEEANDVVRKSTVSRVLHGRGQRAEQRVYPCDMNPGVWHVTSSKDAQPLTKPDGSLIVDYGPDDDLAALRVIARVLVGNSDAHWKVLLTPDRAVQTYRVLGRIRAEVTAQADAKKDELDLMKEQVTLGGSAVWDLYDAKRAYYAWKNQVATFRTAIAQRSIQAEQAYRGVKAHDRAELQERAVHTQRIIANNAAAAKEEARNERLEKAANHSNGQNIRHRAAMRDLVLAIAAHREATTEATVADAELWATLDRVTVPHAGGESTVGAILDSGVWTGPKHVRA